MAGRSHHTPLLGIDPRIPYRIPRRHDPPLSTATVPPIPLQFNMPCIYVPPFDAPSRSIRGNRLLTRFAMPNFLGRVRGRRLLCFHRYHPVFLDTNAMTCG